MGVRPNSAARRPSATNFVRYVEREDCGVIGYTATRSTRAAATAQAAASFPSQTTNFDFGFSAALMQSPPILIASITFRLLPQARRCLYLTPAAARAWQFEESTDIDRRVHSHRNTAFLTNTINRSKPTPINISVNSTAN